MAILTVPLKDLGKLLKAEPQRQLPQIKKAVRLALLRSIPELVKKSPVDTGQYANSWDFQEDEKRMILGNFAPHAAIIEFGARPFTPPIKPLLEWAKRVLKDPSQPPDYSPEVRRLAYGVRYKISKQGMKPKHILTQEIQHIATRIKEEWKKIE
jgi:hypothetical protein